MVLFGVVRYVCLASSMPIGKALYWVYWKGSLEQRELAMQVVDCCDPVKLKEDAELMLTFTRFEDKRGLTCIS
jgi:hypothetical protein